MAVDLIYISRAADRDTLLNKEKVSTQIQKFLKLYLALFWSVNYK